MTFVDVIYRQKADVAQSVAHLIGSEEVMSSILIVSTVEKVVQSQLRGIEPFLYSFSVKIIEGGVISGG